MPKRDIGVALFLSYNTVYLHTKSIYQKLRTAAGGGRARARASAPFNTGLAEIPPGPSEFRQPSITRVNTRRG